MQVVAEVITAIIVLIIGSALTMGGLFLILEMISGLTYALHNFSQWSLQ